MTVKEAWKLRVRLKEIKGCMESWHIQDALRLTQELLSDLKDITEQGEITGSS